MNAVGIFNLIIMHSIPPPPYFHKIKIVLNRIWIRTIGPTFWNISFRFLWGEISAKTIVSLTAITSWLCSSQRLCFGGKRRRWFWLINMNWYFLWWNRKWIQSTFCGILYISTHAVCNTILRYYGIFPHMSFISISTGCC